MWEYVKGSEADFEGAPEWATHVTKANDDNLAWEEDSETINNNKYQWKNSKVTRRYCQIDKMKLVVIAERRKVDDLQSRTNDANLQQEIRIGSGVAPGVHSGPVYDLVQRPAHYNQSGIECIDAIAASMSAEEFRGFLKGNVQKYVWRSEHKGGVEDYRKAQYYLDRLVKELSK